MTDREHAEELLEAARRDLKLLIDLLGEHGTPTSDLDEFVDFNAFAVQYRYESLYVDEQAIDRSSVQSRIDLLIDRVAAAIRT